MSDFETDLRQGLATLAEEAIPISTDVSIGDAPVARLAPPRRRINPWNVVAVAALAAVVVAAVTVVASHSGDESQVLSANADWTAVSSAGAPSPRYSHLAVSSGSQVFVFGGRDDGGPDRTTTAATEGDAPDYVLGDGAIYDVATNAWHPLPAAPIGPTIEPAGVWTGTEFIVTGGKITRAGAAYNPATDTWRTIPDSPTCPRAAAWTGTLMIAAGECEAGGLSMNEVAAYDPQTNQWSEVSAPPTAFTDLVMVGSRVVVWGENHTPYVLDVATGAWSATPGLPIDEGATPVADSAIAVRPPNQLLLSVNYMGDVNGSPTLMYTFDFATMTWSEGRTLDHDGFESPLFAGRSAVANQGDEIVFASAGDLATYDASTGELTGRLESGSPVDNRYGYSVSAVGDHRYLVWGGRTTGDADESNVVLGTGAVLDLG